MSTSTDEQNPDRSTFMRGHELGTEALPVDQYYTDEFFELEKDAIWKDSWLWIGRASDLAKPGDFFVFEFDMLHSSVIIVRGKDGKIRGFHNSCRHRGSPVVFDRAGSTKYFRCTFHGWVYGLDGSLVDVTNKQEYADLDKGCLGLKEVAVETWGGWIFLNYNPTPAHSVHEWMKPLPSALEEYFANENWYWRAGYKEVFKCNWKMMVDTQIEGYHVNSLHQPTVRGTFSPPDMETLAFPNSLGVPGKLEWCMPSDGASGITQTNVAALAVKYGKTNPLYTDKNKAGAFSAAADKYPGALNRANRPDWIFDDWAIFPNTVIFPQKDHMWIQRAWPISPHETAWEWDWYFCSEPPENFGELFSWEQAYTTLRNITTEDVSTVEGMQRSFRSGAVDEMILSGLETSVRGYQNRVLSVVKEYEERRARATRPTVIGKE